MDLLPVKIVPKLWGYEKHLVNSELYCGKILVALPNGMACSIHYHKKKTETFHILKGRLHLQLFALDGRLTEQSVLNPGDSLTLCRRSRRTASGRLTKCVSFLRCRHTMFRKILTGSSTQGRTPRSEFQPMASAFATFRETRFFKSLDGLASPAFSP